MTVTLDGKTLNVTGMDEGVNAVDTQWDVWEDEEYVRKVRVYGEVQTWRLDCYEKGVSWANSQYNHFKGVLKTGDPVAFVVTEGGDTIVSTTVYVLGVSRRYEPGRADSQKYREFQLLLQEV